MNEQGLEPIEVQTKISDAGVCEKKLEITVSKENVTKAFDSVIGELAAQARLPGFRPGKVPRNVVEKRFGDEITKQVTGELLQRGLKSAIQKENLSAIGEPQIEVEKYKAQRENAFAFEARIEIKPTFTLGNYKGMDVEQEEVEVLPEEINAALERIQNRFGEVQDAAAGHAMKNGDSAEGVTRYLVEGKEIHTEADSHVLVMEGQSLGLAAALPASFLEGAKVGEKRSAEETLGVQFPVEGARGKKATIEFEVKTIKTRKLPEINDELAKKMQLGSADELKEKVRSSLLENLREEIKNRTQYDLLDKVVKATPFDLPKRLSDSMKMRTMYSSMQYLQQMGMSPEDFAGMKDKLDADSTEKAESEMRRFFVVDAIAQAESLAVADEDMDEELVKRARAQGMRASELYDRMLQDGSLGELEVDIKIRKVLAYLVEQANVKIVPRKPFDPKAKEGDHSHDHSHSHSHSHDGVACDGDHGHSH